MPSYNVIDQSEGGYAKVEYKGINETGYRNLNTDEPVKQQSYAASKQQETQDTIIIERDESGRIQESTQIPEPEEPEEPELPIRERVTATLKGTYFNEKHGKTQRQKVEVGGVFSNITSPTDDMLWDKLKEARDKAAEEIPPFSDMDRSDMNIERKGVRTFEVQEEITEGEVTLDLWNEHTYTYDYRQSKITEWSN